MPSVLPADRFSRRAIAIFTVLALLFSAGGYALYAMERERIRKEKQEDLSAVADLKVGQILTWWRERKADGEALRSDRFLAEQAARVMESSRNSTLEREMLAWMEGLRESYRYRSVILLDPGGRVRLGTGEDVEEVSDLSRSLALEAARTREVMTVDLHPGPGGRIYFDILSPLPSGPRADRVIGVVLLRSDPRDFLYPLLQRWPTPSRTAETLLVRKEGEEVLFLNDLRHRKGTALSLRLPLSTPRLVAAQAILTGGGMLEGVDYRGVGVIGAERSIPDTPWYLVAKVDREEIDAPIRERAYLAGILTALLILASGAGIAFLGKERQSQLYRRLYEGEMERKALIRHFDWLTRFANDAILLSDDQGRVVEANERAVSAYGYSLGEFQDMDISRLSDPSHAADLEAARPRAWGSGGVLYETLHRRKDGSLFPTEVSTRIIELDGRKFTQDIIRDISERKRMEGELRTAKEELELKNRELEAFTHTAAHDLRTPLTTMNGYLQLLRKSLDPVLDAEQRDIFERIQGSVTHFHQLLEDLLTLTKVVSAEDGAERVAVAPLLEQIARFYQGRMDKRWGTLKVEEGLHDLHIQPAWAYQLFENLFTNSFKFARPGVSLSIEVGSIERPGEPIPMGQRLFFFQDNGVGIEEELQERVFDLFFRAKTGTAHGTGLGLAIVKRIVERLGGKIWLESSPGRGTTFYFTLPVAGQGPPPGDIPAGPDLRV